MISKFLREQKRYAKKDLSEIFECSDEKTTQIIRKLKEYGILKTVRSSSMQYDMSDLADDDVVIAYPNENANKYLYVFTFVGIIIVDGCVLKCYPKYLLHNDKPKDELYQVLKVLEKYNNSKHQIVQISNDSDEDGSYNLLSLMFFLIEDYFENGVYDNTIDIIESNGNGQIDWNRTINETFALIANDCPYYVDLQTRKRISDTHDFFKRLHECILTKISDDLKEADLSDLLGITEIDLSDEDLDDLGGEEYVLYRIEQELYLQFNTRKQLVLKSMYSYISRNKSIYDSDYLTLYGTNSFNLVWESVCSDIFNNQIERPIEGLTLPVPLGPDYQGSEKLKAIIDRPLWTATKKMAKDTWSPDIICISDDKFIIFDAKYYNAVLNDGQPPQGQPGIESVAKQYFYQLSCNKFINEHNFKTVKNCFLMPTEKKNIIDKGEVKMEMLRGVKSEEIALEDIEVRFLPADMAYEYYLSGKKLEINDLKL